MIILKPISDQDFQVKFPQFYKQNTQYFMVMKDDHEAGIYGIITRDQNVCEVAITIFKEFRYKVLSKKTILYLTDFPFSLGFDKVITWSCNKGWIKVLSSLKKYNIFPLDQNQDSPKVWFYKERVV